ncbi:uncharacterized protein LOC129592360 [Paramacrobiotus metropolitanus]|uniref:uncharacterized protein LOC129592360 n=1 Tax=Paramacrobiotus metropolitanus TaxID=2943436 RepID=UPI002445FA55|nr:uncharacterized protein LOC129592360 [Paramacrobiotus metropolitanus]
MDILLRSARIARVVRVFFFMTAALRPGSACLAGRSTCSHPGPSWKDILPDALDHRRQGGQVMLQFPGDNASEAAAQIVRRPRLGESVSFTCRVPAGSDWRSLSWLHRQRTVYTDGQPLPVSDGQQYAFRRDNDTLTFTIANVSLQSSGALMCVDESVYDQYGDTVTLQRYSLWPKVMRPRKSSTRPWRRRQSRWATP